MCVLGASGSGKSTLLHLMGTLDRPDEGTVRLRGERIWQAHREHFYQQAVRRGLGHAAVVERVIAADLVLIGCGWAAENGWSTVALAASAANVAILLTALARGS